MTQRRSSDISGCAGGAGIFGAWTIVLSVLKIAGVIERPWWQVLAPVWVPVTVLIAVVGTIGVIGGTIDWLEGREKRRK